MFMSLWNVRIFLKNKKKNCGCKKKKIIFSSIKSFFFLFLSNNAKHSNMPQQLAIKGIFFFYEAKYSCNIEAISARMYKRKTGKEAKYVYFLWHFEEFFLL